MIRGVLGFDPPLRQSTPISMPRRSDGPSMAPSTGGMRSRVTMAPRSNGCCAQGRSGPTLSAVAPPFVPRWRTLSSHIRSLERVSVRGCKIPPVQRSLRRPRQLDGTRVIGFASHSGVKRCPADWFSSVVPFS
jgi:hypothetical protein